MILPRAKTVIEPFKIKSVEPMPFLEPEQRTQLIEQAEYNLFFLPAKAVMFDLLTDSGTGAMSAAQWAAIMTGDESYAGADSFYHFEQSVQNVTGMKHIIPTHQGRSAESLFMKAFVKPGQVVVGNTHFDTTRANIETSQAIAIDMPSPSIKQHDKLDPFKGNLDTDMLKDYLEKHSSEVVAVIMTVTNNSVGGQPVSLSNMIQTREITQKYGIPLFLDAARFAENAFFIKKREPGYGNLSVREIAKKMFLLADGALMSAKKDTFSNIGGFIAVNDESLAQNIRSLMVLTEGFPTYGGLAGRDLDAIAIGLQEILDERYLAYRIRSVEYFGMGLESQGIRMVKPFGGHAVYLDAAATLPHIPWYQFPGQALSIALYEYIGIRCCEIGSIMLGKHDPMTGKQQPAPMELVRLAMPRRVYTQSHVDYMIEMAGYLAPHFKELRGFEFTYQPPFLRHFTARFRKLSCPKTTQ